MKHCFIVILRQIVKLFNIVLNPLDHEKKLLFFLIFCCCFNSLMADRRPIVIHNGGTVGDHTEYYLPADAPEVNYDSDEMEIIIEADGFASYYNVDIFTMVGTTPILWAVVNGTYDTIDVSSLPADDYRIVIHSSNNNVYEGYFTIE